MDENTLPCGERTENVRHEQHQSTKYNSMRRHVRTYIVLVPHFYNLGVGRHDQVQLIVEV